MKNEYRIKLKSSCIGEPIYCVQMKIECRFLCFKFWRWKTFAECFFLSLAKIKLREIKQFMEEDVND